jgi:hypothetical protein
MTKSYAVMIHGKIVKIPAKKFEKALAAYIKKATKKRG